ncbi:MAG: response regulator transcription factor [Eubacterium sp.]|nr:response regulator transcription factor [Eubacterium sp.]
MYKILIVEDEIAIADMIDMYLTGAGYDCVCASDGEIAANLIEQNSFDLVLLDIMLPKVDGYELMAYLEPLNTPVIFLTAKDTVKDKIKGIRMGADDYIAKPFDLGELLARVEMVLRRFGKGKNILQFQDLQIDLGKHRVTRKGEEINLTPKEFQLLVVLVQNKNTVIQKEDLYEKVWETEYTGNSRTVELHIQRIRNKTGLKEEIKTLPKIGFVLSGESQV